MELRIGIDIGGTYIKAGVVKDEIHIIAKQETPFPQGASCELLADIILQIVNSLCAELLVSKEQIESVGVALPGVLNADRTILKAACNIKLFDAPVKAAIEKRLPFVPVYMENDADAATIAELMAGAFKGCKNALLLTLGTGVGSGVILNGKLFRGGEAGVELGHMPIFTDGLLCSCGKYGCIETLCSASWLVSEGRKIVKSFPLSLMHKKTDGDSGKVTAKLVLDCAKEGNASAKEIFNFYISSLSAAIVCCAKQVGCPEVVALGGGVSLAGNFLFTPLRKRIKETQENSYRIVPAHFKNDAGIIGASAAYKFG